MHWLHIVNYSYLLLFINYIQSNMQDVRFSQRPW